MKFTSIELRAFRNDFKVAIAELEKEYEITIDLGSITYNDTEFTSKMTVKKGTDPIEIERAEFERYASLFGFKREHYRTLVLVGGKLHHIIGFKPRASKNTLIIECKQTKKRYVTRHIPVLDKLTAENR